jgi:hypothetical protein
LTSCAMDAVGSPNIEMRAAAQSPPASAAQRMRADGHRLLYEADDPQQAHPRRALGA